MDFNGSWEYISLHLRLHFLDIVWIEKKKFQSVDCRCVQNLPSTSHVQLMFVIGKNYFWGGSQVGVVVVEYKFGCKVDPCNKRRNMDG